ncbi:MAG: tetratricopeptide repeat protein, partial [Egibacteraceae bacterium]
MSAQLQRIADHRITTVVAGSGYGKTTALAAWAAGADPAWYTVGPEDVDAATMVGGLLAALRRRLPTLPDDLVAAAGSALGPDADPRRIEPAVVAITEALDLTVTDDVALVMDEVHHLIADSPGARLLEGLCRQAPAALHVVLASRAAPAMPLQRLRGQGQVLELDGRLLAFTVEETSALTDRLLGPGSEALVEPLQTLTEGWPAAVRLALTTLEQVPANGRAAALDSLRGPGGAIRAYLHDEAIGQEAPLVREALWLLATVGQADAALLTALGVADADRVLADLRHRGLVVAAVDEPGAFRTSQVVHDAIDDAWDPGADRRVATLRAAATVSGAAGRHDRALALLVAAEDHDAVVALLTEHGGGLLAHGRVCAVLDAVGTLPAERLTEEAALVAGEASQVRGDWEGALGWFRVAAASTGELPAGLAWRMGLIHHLRGELAAADATYARGRLDGSA